MKYRTLKNLIAMMDDKQLDQDVVVFKEGEEQGDVIGYYEKSKQSFYWMDGECYGDRKTTLEYIRQNKKEFPTDDLSINDFTCIPKGTVTLHY